MTTGIMAGIDALAIFILTIPLYYRRHRLRDLVSGRITNLRVISVDLVNDTTLVDVRWLQGKEARTGNVIERSAQ